MGLSYTFPCIIKSVFLIFKPWHVGHTRIQRHKGNCGEDDEDDGGGSCSNNKETHSTDYHAGWNADDVIWSHTVWRTVISEAWHSEYPVLTFVLFILKRLIIALDKILVGTSGFSVTKYLSVCRKTAIIFFLKAQD